MTRAACLGLLAIFICLEHGNPETTEETLFLETLASIVSDANSGELRKDTITFGDVVENSRYWIASVSSPELGRSVIIVDNVDLVVLRISVGLSQILYRGTPLPAPWLDSESKKTWILEYLRKSGNR